MNKEQIIEKMARDIPSKVLIERATTMSEMYYHEHRIAIATKLYNAGYRKVDEDYAIQCTCYALGCQQAEQIETKAKQEVAREIFEEIGKIIEEKYNRFVFKPQQYDSDEEIEAIVNYNDVIADSIAELKKKYIGETQNENN